MRVMLLPTPLWLQDANIKYLALETLSRLAQVCGGGGVLLAGSAAAALC